MDYKELIEYELPKSKEDKPKPQYKIYCDMDGCLTDFQERFIHFSGLKPKEYEKKYGLKAFWELIDVKVGVKFWADMKFMPQGRQLWDYIKEYNPDLLTSPSRDESSRIGKRVWVKNNLTPKPKVIFAYSKFKQNYSNKDSILIDDKPSNIQEWRDKGGIAIECKDGNTAQVINELKELGF